MNNDFIEGYKNFMDNRDGKDITAEEVESSINKAEQSEAALVAAVLALFSKKRKSMSDMVKTLEGMGMFLSMLSVVKSEDIPDIPDNKEIIAQGKKTLAAIEKVIESLQNYTIEYNKFNEVVKCDISKKEEFKSYLDEVEE